jgi:hypothetical protein
MVSPPARRLASSCLPCARPDLGDNETTLYFFKKSRAGIRVTTSLELITRTSTANEKQIYNILIDSWICE